MKAVVRRAVRACMPYGLVERRRRRMAADRGRVGEPIPLSIEERSVDRLLPRGVPETVQLPTAELVRCDFMVSPPRELAVIGAICRAMAPNRIFEFGTYIGSATRVMAMNCDAQIATLDIDPETRERLYGPAHSAAVSYQSGSAFLGTPEAARVKQVFGDSRTFDYGPYVGLMDLVFVDANHTYPFVKNDSEWALRLLRPGGLVVWDDYAYTLEHPECSGVAQYVNELSRRMPCYRIEGTRLAVGFEPPQRHD